MTPPRIWTIEKIVSLLREDRLIYEDAVRVSDWDGRSDRPSKNTVKKYCGSWANACRLAGFEPSVSYGTLREFCRSGHSMDDAYFFRGKPYCRTCMKNSRTRRPYGQSPMGLCNCCNRELPLVARGYCDRCYRTILYNAPNAFRAFTNPEIQIGIRQVKLTLSSIHFILTGRVINRIPEIPGVLPKPGGTMIALSKIEDVLDRSIDRCDTVQGIAVKAVQDNGDPYSVWAHTGAAFATNGTIMTAKKVGVVEE